MEGVFGKDEIQETKACLTAYCHACIFLNRNICFKIGLESDEQQDMLWVGELQLAIETGLFSD